MAVHVLGGVTDSANQNGRFVVSAAALVSAVEYFWAYSNSGPTPEEFRVYAVFLNRKAADEHMRPNDFALARMTLEQSDPQYESWTPPELRHDKTYPSAGGRVMLRVPSQQRTGMPQPHGGPARSPRLSPAPHECEHP
jgi:hypothetical protein